MVAKETAAAKDAAARDGGRLYITLQNGVVSNTDSHTRELLLLRILPPTLLSTLRPADTLLLVLS